MRPPPILLLVAAAAALLDLAPAHAVSPARCDGKHRRTANPFGSVLATGLKPAAASAPAANPAPARVPTATAAPKPTVVSRAELRASFAPCGGAA